MNDAASQSFPGGPNCRYLLLFDGDCGWCSGWAAWLVRHKPHGRMILAPLSGTTAQPFVGSHPPTDTMVLVVRETDGRLRLYTHSEAVFITASALGWPWRALGLFKLLPRKLTDAMYRWVARNRHRLSGLPAHQTKNSGRDCRIYP